MADEWDGMKFEFISNKLKCLITEEQAQFLEKFVSNIDGNEFEILQINYKKDFILTKELEEMSNVLNDTFSKISMNFWDGVDEEDLSHYADDDELPDYLTISTNDGGYSLDDVTIIKEGESFYVELEVVCEVSY